MATLTVGTGTGFEYHSLNSAVSAAQNGDVIQVQAGTYTNDFTTITKSITIEGVGGMVNLVGTVPPPDLKGILTIGTTGGSGPDVTLDNLSFSGAAISDIDGGNGAGIRYQSGNLTLNNTYFFGNQDGLLADADPTGSITINNSEFTGNGNADSPSGGIEHNLYVGAIQDLTIDNSYFSDPIGGHDIKSRAADTTIENSRIDDPNGMGSYEIDLPNGGNAVLKNNVIEKGSGAGNANFVSFGEEGSLYSGSTLSVTGNTIENDYGRNANFVVNATSVPVSVTGNVFYGLKKSHIVSGSAASPESNAMKPHVDEPSLNTAPAYLPVIPISLACFAAGTGILTPEGEVPVETLTVGQDVIVAGTGAEKCAKRSICWIGQRRIDLQQHADPHAARPIRILAHAFADNVPRRDLLISPDHAILIDGMLVPARLLRNGATILRDDHLQAVQYFHVELESHDVLIAEGLQAESYLDTGNRGMFENARSPFRPDLSVAFNEGQALREMGSCAPFVADAERVEPLWRRLSLRALQLGHELPKPATTSDPALRLLVDGRLYGPTSGGDDGYRFVVPRGVASVRLLSRSTAPCDLTPWLEDRRDLGVAVGRIVLINASGQVDMLPDDVSLTDGWWAVERDESHLWRWTDGDAGLSLPPHVTGIEVYLAGKTTYRARAQSSSAAKRVNGQPSPAAQREIAARVVASEAKVVRSRQADHFSEPV